MLISFVWSSLFAGAVGRKLKATPAKRVQGFALEGGLPGYSGHVLVLFMDAMCVCHLSFF